MALVAGGKLFQARAAAAGNARSPMVERRVDRTFSCENYELQKSVV